MAAQVVETDLAIVAGQLPAVSAQSNTPIAWEVEISPINGQLFSPQQYTPANYAAALATVNVDGVIAQANVNATDVYTAKNWLTLGPRGARLSAFGRSVTIQFSSTSTAPAVIATNPALAFHVRVAPAIGMRFPDNQRVVQLARGDLNGLAGALQLPAFSTEFRLSGGSSPFNGFILIDATFPGGSPSTLVDPYTLIQQLGFVNDVGEWTPLHPLAAGVFLTSGTILETR
jgi:hypothetical protein